MKRKIVTICLAAILVIIAVAGASLAYLTDTDHKKNTFTVGDVKIELDEKFEENAKLKPGKSNDGSAVQKVVTVKNTGDEDAWVWVELRIPAYLVSADYKAEPHKDESKNALHWNTYGCFNVEYNSGNYWASAIRDGYVNDEHKVTDANMVAVEDGLWYDYKFVGIEGEGDDAVVVIRSKMENALPAGKTSLPALSQVYMDWRIDSDGDNYVLPDGTKIAKTASWEIDVTAYAIQKAGFNTVDEAIAAFAEQTK